MYLNIILIACHATAAWSLYQDTGYPYEEGPLEIDTLIYTPDLMPINTPPMHSKIYFPIEADEYAVFYFVTGFGGLNPGFIYDDVMANISTHGYVVVNTWPFNGEDGPAFSYEEHLKNLDWLAENLRADTGDAVPSFNDVAVGGHSSGVTPTLYMALNRTEQIKALVNLEPVSDAIRQDQPEHYLPSFNFGAELANMSCSYPGVDFVTWQNFLDCPKIMVEAAGAGHCDILDPEIWPTCSRLFCKATVPLTGYRDLVSGLSSAFMTAYVQGNMDQLEYITDKEQIPWEILLYDVAIDC